MNRAQQKYALERIEEIMLEKRKEYIKEYVESIVPLTAGEIEKMLKAGELKLKSRVPKKFIINDRHDLGEIFDVEIPIHNLYNTFEQDTDKATQDKIKKLRKKCQEISDRIMLGDNEEALKALAELEKI